MDDAFVGFAIAEPGLDLRNQDHLWVVTLVATSDHLNWIVVAVPYVISFA